MKITKIKPLSFLTRVFCIVCGPHILLTAFVGLHVNSTDFLERQLLQSCLVLVDIVQ